MLVVALVALFFCFPVTHSINYKELPHEIIKVKLKKTGNRETIEFIAFGKTYNAIVHRFRQPVHNNFQAQDGDGKEVLTDLDGIFVGHLKGSKNDRIYLNSVPGGSFLGYVRDGDDLLHLEPAKTHIPGAKSHDTIIYKESDIRSKTSIFFGLSSPLLPPTTKSYREKRENPLMDHVRSQKLPSLENEKKNRCPLKIVADHRFFNVVGKGDKATTAKYILNTIARVNEIFEAVNWDEHQEGKVKNRGRFFNFGFSIKELKIWDKPSPEKGHYNGNDTEGASSWSASRLLEVFTQAESSTDFCIVHLMTAQSFSDGTSLGLAYVATEDTGGICSDKKQFGERSGSYNTLLSSVIGNSAKEKKDYPLVTREAEIIVAHEYAHSWGAVHDEAKLQTIIGLNETCSPEFRGGGKYIMHPFAQAGFDPNNDKFSPCSVFMIRNMLQRRWSRCFEVEKDSLCGNGVVEDGEQCDEGALFKTPSDSPCCSRNCTLLRSAQCSPENSPCCSSFCSFHNASHLCLQEDPWQCKSKTFCTGRSGECPPPKPVKDGIICAGEGKCQTGNCVPYCESLGVGKKSCICEEVQLSCKRCCRAHNGTGPCLPEESASDLTDGSWCIQGYCKNSRCITEAADYVTYYLGAFQDSNIFWKMVRSNIVGLVVLTSLPLWIFVGCCVTRHDRLQKVTFQDRQITGPLSSTQFIVHDSATIQPILSTSPVQDDSFF